MQLCTSLKVVRFVYYSKYCRGKFPVERAHTGMGSGVLLVFVYAMLGCAEAHSVARSLIFRGAATATLVCESLSIPDFLDSHASDHVLLQSASTTALADNQFECKMEPVGLPMWDINVVPTTRCVIERPAWLSDGVDILVHDASFELEAGKHDLQDAQTLRVLRAATLCSRNKVRWRPTHQTGVWELSAELELEVDVPKFVPGPTSVLEAVGSTVLKRVCRRETTSLLRRLDAHAGAWGEQASAQT